MSRRPLPPHDPENPLSVLEAKIKDRTDSACIKIVDHKTTSVMAGIGTYLRQNGDVEVARKALDIVQDAVNDAHELLEAIIRGENVTQHYQSRWNSSKTNNKN